MCSALTDPSGARFIRQGYTSRLGYLTSFYGVVDLITILPFYADSILDALHSPLDATDLRVFRVFRGLSPLPFLLLCLDFLSLFSVLAYTLGFKDGYPSQNHIQTEELRR